MKPIFTIHAGEYLVGSEIENRFKNARVWVPSKDTGIDLLVTNNACKSPISLQVKFSKDFFSTRKKTQATEKLKSGGWWQFNKDKIESSPADYWVLVLYQFQSRQHDFIIIKPSKLIEMYNTISSSKSKIQSYVWVTDHKTPQCWETRGLNKSDQIKISEGQFVSKARNLTKYLNNWSCIEKLNN